MARELWSTKIILPPPYRAADRVVKAIRITFIAICASLALLPLVGMLWAPTNATSENRELASFPPLIDKSGVNFDFLSDLGGYFEDHFAYRSMFATASATLSTQLRTSANPEVVVLGEDGWLYYQDTTSDYLGSNLISPHDAENIAFNLSLIRDYCSLYGASFAVTVAPNKNSLYPEHMPYYLGEPGENHTFQILANAMNDKRISYFDAYETFSSRDDVLYYLRDSHWNSNGARIASENLLRCLGDDDSADRLANLTPEWREDYVGDLNIMLYPDNSMPEYDAHFEDQVYWSNEEGETIEDGWIKTRSGAIGADGTLIMFRDSFGNNMIQFLADSYETSYFSRTAPFDIQLVSEIGATDVILEFVERNLKQFCMDPAVMPAPLTSISDSEIVKGAIDKVQGWNEILISEAEGYGVIEGCIPEEYADQNTSDIFVGISKGGITNWYVPFKVTISGSSYGYRAFVNEDMLHEAENISIVVNNAGALRLVQTTG